jgi:hypothetical protein
MTSSTSRELGVYVTTCDEMSFCLQAFCYLFNKFWPYETTINVLGYEDLKFDLPNNVKFHSLGKDLGADNWSNDMIKFFSDNKEHDYFLMAPEDGFLIKEVDENLLNAALFYSKSSFNANKSFLRFGLTDCVSSRPHHVLGKLNESSDLILSAPFSDYRHSLQHSIWNRENFLKMLKPNMNPWQIELDEAARNDGFDVLAFRGKCPIHIGHSYMKGKKVPTWYKDVWEVINGNAGLNKNDIDFIESSGWLPEIQPRVRRDSSGNVI